MGCLGLHFALDSNLVAELRAQASDAERLDYLYDFLEEDFWAAHPECVAETDKAWDAIHRALTDGHLDYDQGVYPLSHVVMGGERIYFEDDHIMVLKTPAQVKAAARALGAIDKPAFRTVYFQIESAECGYAIDEGDFDYTWTWFESLRRFWQKAAASERSVLFSASQ